MAKQNLIPALVALGAIALGCAACTVTRESASTGDPNNPSEQTNGINVHVGDGTFKFDTPIFKVNKNGTADKLHVDIPQMRLEPK